MTSVQVEIGLYYNGASGMMNMPPLVSFVIVSCNVMCAGSIVQIKISFSWCALGGYTKRIGFVRRNT